MTWHRVDDGFPEHPKLAALEGDPRLWADAMALWLAAACYCRRAGTDGFVSTERLGRLTPIGAKRAAAVARALVERARVPGGSAGLWVAVEGGFRFHDWDDYGPAPRGPETSPKASKGAERTRRWREGRASHGDVTERHCDASQSVTAGVTRDAPGVTDSVTPGVTGDVTDGVTVTRHEQASPRAHVAARPRPVPSRPNSDRSSEDGELAGVARARAPVSSPEAPPTPEPPTPLALARSLLTRGYQRRYEARRGDAWLGASKAHTDIGTCAAWAVAQPERLVERVEALLDAVFADPWLTERAWPWGAIARDPARYVGAPAAFETREPSDYERLLRALDRAEQRGDYDSIDRLRAELDALSRRAS